MIQFHRWDSFVNWNRTVMGIPRNKLDGRFVRYQTYFRNRWRFVLFQLAAHCQYSSSRLNEKLLTHF